MEMVAIKERPILFSGPMVRAILNGRKTQTRRVVKPQDYIEAWENGAVMTKNGWIPELDNPYGQPGDRLWVREKHKIWLPDGGPEWSCIYDDGQSADGLATWDEGDQYLSPEDAGLHVLPKRWRPSIYMPRWASRITLEITGVRVERLNEISEDDARAEGMPTGQVHPEMYDSLYSRDRFIETWESINGPESWDENPWVWVVEFQRIEPAEAGNP